MYKYSIWISTSFIEGKKDIDIWSEAEDTEKPIMTFSIDHDRGILTMSNGVIAEYDMKNETFGIMSAPNANTHVYRDGDCYSLQTDEEIDWITCAADDSVYTWIKRD